MARGPRAHYRQRLLVTPGSRSQRGRCPPPFSGPAPIPLRCRRMTAGVVLTERFKVVTGYSGDEIYLFIRWSSSRRRTASTSPANRRGVTRWRSRDAEVMLASKTGTRTPSTSPVCVPSIGGKVISRVPASIARRKAEGELARVAARAVPPGHGRDGRHLHHVEGVVQSFNRGVAVGLATAPATVEAEPWPCTCRRDRGRAQPKRCAHRPARRAGVRGVRPRSAGGQACRDRVDLRPQATTVSQRGFRASPLVDAQGAGIRVSGIATDLTEVRAQK